MPDNNKPTKNINIIAIIPAAGIGARMKNEIPKAYIELAGKPMIYHSLERFGKHPEIKHIIGAAHREHQTFVTKMKKDFPKIHICHGGARRQDSVRYALNYIKKFFSDPAQFHILIHDAARPFLSNRLLKRLIEAAKQYPNSAVIAGLKSADTLRLIKRDGTTETLPRERIFRIQTPQLFPFDTLHKLHQTYDDIECTDDAGLFEHGGKPIKIIAGDPNNIKITYPKDLKPNR